MEIFSYRMPAVTQCKAQYTSIRRDLTILSAMSIALRHLLSLMYVRSEAGCKYSLLLFSYPRTYLLLLADMQLFMLNRCMSL